MTHRWFTTTTTTTSDLIRFNENQLIKSKKGKRKYFFQRRKTKRKMFSVVKKLFVEKDVKRKQNMKIRLTLLINMADRYLLVLFIIVLVVVMN